MEKLVIDRTKWLRGTGNGWLLNNEGRMCCLGFECLRHGVVPQKIDSVNMPNSIRDSRLPVWLMGTDADLAANVNDNMNIDDLERESQIKDIFARHEIEVEFVNQ